jgi:DNA primase large subunit
MSRKLVWQRALVFILQYREIFEFKFEYDRDGVLRQMLYKIRDLVAPEMRRYEPKLANKLFEMLYAEVRSIIKIWLEEGAKTEEISQVARCLDCAANSVCKKWSGFFCAT